PAIAARASTSPVAGSKTSRTSPDAGSARPPSMKSPYSFPVATATENGRYRLTSRPCRAHNGIREGGPAFAGRPSGSDTGSEEHRPRGEADVDSGRRGGTDPGP